jgi:hypothetical protein
MIQILGILCIGIVCAEVIGLPVAAMVLHIVRSDKADSPQCSR